MQSLVLHMYSHTVETALKCIKSQYIKIIPSKSLFGHYKAVLWLGMGSLSSIRQNLWNKVYFMEKLQGL